MTIHPFWLRTSVMARSNVRSAKVDVGEGGERVEERISSCGVEPPSGSAPGARRSRRAAGAGPRRPAWPTRRRPGSDRPSPRRGVRRRIGGRPPPARRDPRPTVPIRFDGEARKVGVRSPSPGVASKPRAVNCGPNSAPTAWRSAPRGPPRPRCDPVVRSSAGRRGPTAAGSGSRPSLERPGAGTPRASSVRPGGGPGVGHQVGPLERGQLGGARPGPVGGRSRSRPGRRPSRRR
jgi:hypothetical protein